MMYLNNVKILLEIDEGDESKDGLLGLYTNRAKDFVLDFCKIDSLPSTLDSTIEEMVVFQYRQKGIENIQSEEKGSLSEIYLTEYPPNIMNRLKSHRRVVFL
jgi:hypothetical protein